MSEQLTRYWLGELGLRDVYDAVVVSGPKRSDSHAHLPEGDDGTETLCDNIKKAKNPKRKPMKVFPDGYLTWCHTCLSNCEHIDESIRAEQTPGRYTGGSKSAH